jgi:hypothetical protein
MFQKHYIKYCEIGSSTLTWSNIEAFAQRIPPRNVRELAGLEVPLKFLVELTAIITSSAPSQFSTDHPSSLNPFTASLKPLHI